MSNVSSPPELDFWEFVHCGICHLDFVKDTGALSATPFWLTECGHVVCNSHINANQTCAECGSVRIQLLPLQKEMEMPMANWFISAPTAFDAVGFALRFQMNTMAGQVRFFKNKYLQYRPLYDRLKEQHAENKRLRKETAELQKENQYLRQKLQLEMEEGQVNDSNKRRRLDEDGHYNGHRTSSPRSSASIPTIGPDRLTLPPGNHQPNFNPRQPHRTYESSKPPQDLIQYAYIPPRSAQSQSMPPPILTHIQSGPTRRAQALEEGELQSNRTMAPPPIPAKRFTEQRQSMQPPATPAGLPQRPSFAPSTAASHSALPGAARRFVPQTPSKTEPMTPAMTPRGFAERPNYYPQQQAQRFVPASPQRPPSVISNSGSGALNGSGRVLQSSRPSSIALASAGGQRTPFIPGAAGNFS